MRGKRTLTAQLAAIVLGFEAVIVALGGLVIWGLKVLPESVPNWWALVGGAVVSIAMVLTAGYVHRQAGIVTGWVLQGIVAASAVLVPTLLVVALLFGAMYAYATIQGPRIEARGRTAAPEGEEHAH